jgi:UDP-N-acetylmuramoylalanine--D-glutamate ligase
MQKRIVILGAGESGTGAALLASKQGYDVFVSDKGKVLPKYAQVLNAAGISSEEGKHTERLILSADEIIKSPGIPETAGIITMARNEGIGVISEIEFAARYTNAHKTCITGSNGKTTTTLWTYHILKNAGLNVGLAGNVGKSFAWQVAENNFDHYVLEISSFQLDGMYKFKADTAVLMNITPDHLDRYQYDFQKYTDSKFRIINNQGANDAFIYCYDDSTIRKELENKTIKSKCYPFSIRKKLEEGAFLQDQNININIHSNTLTMTLEALALQGKHNMYNSMAAGIAARVLDIRKDTVKECLSDFQNIEHRLEFVANIHGIEFINDSKATNINSTWYALESYDKQIIWIAGGVDKGNDYSKLEELVTKKVKAIICLGIDNEKLIDAFYGTGIEMFQTRSMEEAVALAYRHGKPNDVVLLSPACASFDLFENYEERGTMFKEAVKSL